MTKLKEKYPKDTPITLINMKGEPQMPEGLKGVVTSVDDIGQIHVKWENGSTLALNEGVDNFTYDTIKILVVEPGKKPYVKIIPETLEAEQEVVGGLIEITMPFDDEVALVCNEEGKLDKLPPNRPIIINNEIIDFIQGTFFICYAPADSERFMSLPQKYINKYMDMFKDAAKYFQVPDNDGTLTEICEKIFDTVNKLGSENITVCINDTISLTYEDSSEFIETYIPQFDHFVVATNKLTLEEVQVVKDCAKFTHCKCKFSK